MISSDSFHQRKYGFSLLEVLVVIVIIVTLASLGVPLVNRIRHMSYAAQCSAKLRQVGIGMNLYLGEHNRTFPVLAPAKESRDDTETPVIERVLLDYVNDDTVFDCPADHEFYKNTGSSYFWNTLINGQRMGSMDLLGIIKQEAGIPIISDKENFHKYVGAEVNILYADGSIHKGLQFTVELDDN